MSKRWMLLPALLAALFLGGCFGLDFSPDGKQLAVVIGGKLVIVNADGTGRAEIASGKGMAGASWSPDGRYVAYVNGADSPTDLCLYDTRTKKTRTLGKDYVPAFAWREDSKRLAVLRQPGGTGPYSVVQYNLPEGGASLTTKLPFGGVGPVLVWIPSTDNVALLGVDKDKMDVYAVEFNEVNKISTSGDVVGLSLSPDKNHLVFARKGPNLKYILLSVYAYDLTKRRVGRLDFPERLTPVNPNPRTAPKSLDYVAISPDMKRLAITVTQPTGKVACYVAGFDGTDVRLLRSGPANSILLPVWSKDGSKVAVQYTEDKAAGVTVFAKDGTGATKALAEKP